VAAATLILWAWSSTVSSWAYLSTMAMNGEKGGYVTIGFLENRGTSPLEVRNALKRPESFIQPSLPQDSHNLRQFTPDGSGAKNCSVQIRPAASGHQERKRLRKMSKKIYVGNLPFSANDDELRALFATHGDVQSVNLITDRETGRLRGFGFVEMDESGADAAIAALDGQDMGGRALKVNEARPRREGGGGGGGGRGAW